MINKKAIIVSLVLIGVIGLGAKYFVGNTITAGETEPEPISASSCSEAAQKIIDGSVYRCRTYQLKDAKLVYLTTGYSDCFNGCIPNSKVELVYPNGSTENLRVRRPIFCPERINITAEEAKKQMKEGELCK